MHTCKALHDQHPILYLHYWAAPYQLALSHLNYQTCVIKYTRYYFLGGPALKNNVLIYINICVLINEVDWGQSNNDGKENDQFHNVLSFHQPKLESSRHNLQKYFSCNKNERANFYDFTKKYTWGLLHQTAENSPNPLHQSDKLYFKFTSYLWQWANEWLVQNTLLYTVLNLNNVLFCGILCYSLSHISQSGAFTHRKKSSLYQSINSMM